MSDGLVPQRARHYRDDVLTMYYRCLSPRATRVRYRNVWSASQCAGHSLVIADSLLARTHRGHGFLSERLERCQALEPRISHIELENVFNVGLVDYLKGKGWTKRRIGPVDGPNEPVTGACWFIAL
ncbi:hypothetical protein [Acidovorax sp. sic0104]|uniref:hypothetical protein n=1 Tax=Acidovorax sp. sic0104 TaxID=2854784 RepID=UPI001C45D1AB|nr:hypothetical protein [Acidovorax sp. sic0104]MBV7541996.1 hypothetical protein [Acidovorax sp. sic0104]